MIQMTWENMGDGNFVRRYTDAVIQVRDVDYEASLIITADRIIDSWQPSRFDQLNSAHLQAIVELQPEVVILGTGHRQHFPHPSLLQPLMERRIGIEIMSSAAACRTWNILLAEGRNALAALLIER